MLDSTFVNNTDTVVEFDKWKVKPLILSEEKVVWLWNEMHRFKSLFSTLTINDTQNFTNVLTQADSLWWEVEDDEGNTVGLLSITDLHRVIDCEVHMMFFDARPHEKVQLVKLLIKYVFEHYPLRRMTVTIPSFYHSTIRLVRKLGFKEEGCKVQSQIIGNKWVDEMIFGLLRQEVV